MSDRLAYILVEDGITTCYYHRWGNVNFPLKLVQGPQTIKNWAIHGYDSLSTEALDSCAEAEVLIDYDRKHLLYWHSLYDYERVYVPYVNALLAENWSGFTVQFAYRGRLDLADYSGLPTEDPSGPGYPDSVVDPDLLVCAGGLETALYLLATISERWSSSFSEKRHNKYRYDDNERTIIKEFALRLIQKSEREVDSGETEALPEIVETSEYRGFYRMPLVEMQRLISASQPDEITLLDVRSAEAFESGHFADSVSIPLHELPERYQELFQNKTVICIGSGGRIADAAAHFLIEKDFWCVSSLHSAATG